MLSIFFPTVILFVKHLKKPLKNTTKHMVLPPPTWSIFADKANKTIHSLQKETNAWICNILQQQS